MPSLQLQSDDKLTPISLALPSMNALRDWTPDDKEKFNISTVPPQPRIKDALKPKLLVTHDMAGGYKEDRSIQGNAYRDIYYIKYWHLIDTFVYFSHERVSIPPVNWTNACHRNGVKCLGTFLVEGNNQMHEMESLLNGPPLQNIDDDDPMRLWSPYYADKLVAIAKHYGFDGWLINIECEFFPFPTSSRFKAQELAKFLHYLTDKMHEQVPGSQIIWYDSMTDEGEIHWQNQLNWKNELFFKNTDGIFLNYWWKEEYPEMARRVAERCGKKGTDVYFGTDVWGRHTFGGGNFKSYKGVQTASSAMTSSALFATAWTYEAFEKSEFEKMDRLFWRGGDHSEYPPPKERPEDKGVLPHSDDSEDELLHGHRKGIVNVVDPLVPKGNWFYTNFDRGFGREFYFKGKKILDQPWSHLSHQAILPNRNYLSPAIYPLDENFKFTCLLDDNHGAFMGGTALVIKGRRLKHRESRDIETEMTIPLYEFCLDITAGCSLSYTYKSSLTEVVKLSLMCDFTIETEDITEFYNEWQPLTHSSFENDDELRATVSTNDATETRCLQLQMFRENTEHNGWITKSIEIPAVPEKCKLRMNRLQVNVFVDTASLVGIDNHVIACLGQLVILPTISESLGTSIGMMAWKNTELIKCNREDLIDIAQEEIYRHYGTLEWETAVELKNEWEATDYYKIYYQEDATERVFLGTAFCEQYRLSGLDVVLSKTPKIIIEAVNRKGSVSASAFIGFPSS